VPLVVLVLRDGLGGEGREGVGHGLTLSREVGCCVEADGWRRDRWNSRWEYECGWQLREEALIEGALEWHNGIGFGEWVKKWAPDAEMDGYMGGYIREASAFAVSSTVERWETDRGRVN